jgi:CBS domain-containing protein
VSRTRLLARDLMTRDPVSVRENLTIGALCDLLQEKNVNGAPVVDGRGNLVGVVTQEDIIYGAMGTIGAPPAAGHDQAPLPGADQAPGPAGAPGDAAPAGALSGAAPAGPPGRPGKRVVQMIRQRRLKEVPEPSPRPGERRFWTTVSRSPDPMELPIRTIMTSPAISAEEDTPVEELCRIMWSLKIHRVPIVRAGKVTGLVSSMDLCRAILQGKIRI